MECRCRWAAWGWLLVACLAGEIASGNRAALAVDPSATASERDELTASLKSLWSGYQSEIATAEIEFTSFTFSLQDRSFSLPDFEEAIRDESYEDREGLARRLAEKFFSEKLTGSPGAIEQQLAAMVDRRRFLQRGRERRLLGQPLEHVMTGDLHLLADAENEEVRAFRRGACPYWCQTLDWFRTVPRPEMLSPATAFMPQEGGLLRVDFEGRQEAPATWMAIDPSDGLPRRWELISPGSGELTRLELYRDYVLYPGGVLLPRVRLQAHVKDRMVRHVMLTVIDNARFNASVDDAAFRLSAPARWAWLDYRGNETEGGKWPAKVDDVAVFFQGRKEPEAQARGAGATRGNSRQSAASWRSALLILNGLALAALGAVLWKRSA